jgi:hypothetical protein
VPYGEERSARQPGMWRGRIWIAEDFDDTHTEAIESFGTAP